MGNPPEMQHSQSRSSNPEVPEQPSSSPSTTKRHADGFAKEHDDHKKAKRDNNRRQKGPGGVRKGKGMGRGEYYRLNIDKRIRNDKEQQKREDADTRGMAQPIYSTKFSQEEIAGEDRRPKRKVAVLIGYSGSGYKGMQIMPNQKTIEGDLFQAFVKANAISKANADDPKKSQLVRCARTDKGVHAAGNVISLKLIIEDPDIVQKINDQLPPQIRVWGIERTIGSFSCYAACDSRWYEYLIPTYCLLPPHPSSWMAKQLKQLAEEDGESEAFNERQKEVLSFWEGVEAQRIQPILASLDQETKSLVEQAIYHTEEVVPDFLGDDEEDTNLLEDENAAMPTMTNPGSEKVTSGGAEDITSIVVEDVEQQLDANTADHTGTEGAETEVTKRRRRNSDPVEIAIKAVKAAYIDAKTEYRISPERLARVRDVLSRYDGTHNFHNFTIKKSPRDPSAKRFIRSFEVNGDPVIINGTEWLSLKVHGQSFMMHQIRKMVAMAAMIVRCGCPPDRLRDAMSADIYNIPKAPSLGLLLERPVFDSYNTKAAGFDKNAITFAKYEKEMLEFKQREIYDKIFQVEAQDHVFHTFFAHVDNYRMPSFLYLSSRGVAASKGERPASESQSLSRTQRKEYSKAQNASRVWGKRDGPAEAGAVEGQDHAAIEADKEVAAPVTDEAAGKEEAMDEDKAADTGEARH